MQEQERGINMNCGYNINSPITDLIWCIIYNMGISYEIFALFVLAIFVIYALYSRLDFDISLGFAFILVYCLLAFSGSAGSSYLLQITFGILAVGIAIRILIGLISMNRQ
jgi:hypothetical protein